MKPGDRAGQVDVRRRRRRPRRSRRTPRRSRSGRYAVACPRSTQRSTAPSLTATIRSEASASRCSAAAEPLGARAPVGGGADGIVLPPVHAAAARRRRRRRRRTATSRRPRRTSPPSSPHGAAELAPDEPRRQPEHRRMRRLGRHERREAREPRAEPRAAAGRSQRRRDRRLVEAGQVRDRRVDVEHRARAPCRRSAMCRSASFVSSQLFAAHSTTSPSHASAARRRSRGGSSSVRMLPSSRLAAASSALLGALPRALAPRIVVVELELQRASGGGRRVGRARRRPSASTSS